MSLLTPTLLFSKQLPCLVIGSCVTCTDPILSQAIAKGPFADKYVARHLREIISSEAGMNDGFGFPFLMLAVYLMRYADGQPTSEHGAHGAALMARSGDVGRQGGGADKAIAHWVVETWLYYILMGAVYGVVVGYGSLHALRFGLRRYAVDSFVVSNSLMLTARTESWSTAKATFYFPRP